MHGESLILREHVEHLGDRGEIVTVAPGYARNYLLPKGLALVATPATSSCSSSSAGSGPSSDAKEDRRGRRRWPHAIWAVCS